MIENEIQEMSKIHGKKHSRISHSFRDGWVNVGGIMSHVLTWGGWIDDPLPPGGTILLFMCGIPGLTFFYKNFLEELHNRLKIPVWTVCIAGHEIPPPHVVPELPQDWSLYNSVRAQADHKVEFVKKYVPRDKKVILVGHSFGGKMALELLKDDDLESRMVQCVLLMPTLERFADLPGAQYWRNLRNSGILYLLILLVWIVSLLPVTFRRKVSEWYFHNRGVNSVDSYCVDAMTEFTTPAVFNNVRTIVKDEFSAIKDLDVDVLKKVKDRTKIFFAMKDQWAPLTHYHSLREAVPQLDVEILDHEFEHAFCLKTPHLMADIISEELNKNIVETM